jgi:hypothetical protein
MIKKKKTGTVLKVRGGEGWRRSVKVRWALDLDTPSPPSSYCGRELGGYGSECN